MDYKPTLKVLCKAHKLLKSLEEPNYDNIDKIKFDYTWDYDMCLLVL